MAAVIEAQEAALPDRLKAKEALDLYASLYPDPVDPWALLEEWGLAGKRSTSFASLSGGQRQWWSPTSWRRQSSSATGSRSTLPTR